MKEKLSAKIKFSDSSKEVGALVGFVRSDYKNNRLVGVNELSTSGKKIVLPSKELHGKIQRGVLYTCELLEMNSKKGYIALTAEPVTFATKIEVVHVPKSIYKIKASFGNKEIFLDFIDGKTTSSQTIKGVKEVLESRFDIENKESVISEFMKKAHELKAKFDAEGMIQVYKGQVIKQ